MTVHASFAEELAWLQNRDDGFLALLGEDGQLHPSFLNVKHRVGDVALLEDVLVLAKFSDRFPRSDFGDKTLGVKLVISWLSHRSLLWLGERHLT